MESEGASSLWFFAVVGGTILLGLALLIGFLQWRKRSGRVERISEDIARDNYQAESEREERREREGT